ncbi:MAG: hypothetical protein WA101_03100 [Minisyncoccia bacterium]
MFRISASIILLFSILFMPFWLSVLLALLGIIYFPFFLEAIFLLLISDLLFGTREAQFSNTIFISLIVSTVFFILVEIIKRKMRFYNK